MTLSRAATFIESATGGRAISTSSPSWRSRIRKVFSYGSKWMSDAPRRIASSITLFTKRTIGASSTSALVISPPTSSSPAEISRFSRSKSSSPRSCIVVSSASIARATRVSSLSCSTTTGSMRSVVWNLTSSSAWRLVGSQTAT